MGTVVPLPSRGHPQTAFDPTLPASGVPTRRVFRPGIWGALLGGGAIVVMLGLGTWQVQRLTWKRDLLAHIQERMAQAPVALPTAIADPAAWDYRRVRLDGRFDHAHELYVGARTVRGNIGYEVVTPFIRADGGGVVLVDRGWVPLDRHHPADRPQGQVDGVVTVDGVARVPPPRHWAQPDNRPQENFWLYYDLPAMAAAAGAGQVAPVVVEADAAPNPGGYPLGGQTRVTIPNDHLQYALTWYMLAAALAVICWLKFSLVVADTGKQAKE